MLKNREIEGISDHRTDGWKAARQHWLSLQTAREIANGQIGLRRQDEAQLEDFTSIEATHYLLRSPRNADELRASIRELNAGDGTEQIPIE